MPTGTLRKAPQLSALPGFPNRYLAPTATQAVGVVTGSRKTPVHILLALDSGHEMEIPLTQAAILKLKRILSPFRYSP